MTTEYRVTVEKIERDEDGDPRGSVVLELLAPGAMLARFAPGAVAEVLGAERAAVTVVMPQDVPEGDEPDTPAVNPERHYRPAAEPAAGDVPAAEPTKRKRRTKAEIAADKEAQALGFRDAAHRAEAAAVATAPGDGPTGDGDADLAALAAAGATTGGVAPAAAPTVAEGSYMAPDGPVVAEAPAPVPASTVPASAEPPAAAPAAAVPAGQDGQPWNPFAQ